jgi:hypothetical protein
MTKIYARILKLNGIKKSPDINFLFKYFKIKKGFGLTDFLSNKSGNISNRNLIKRYNYYSMRVLNSMEETIAKDRTQFPSKP